MSSIISFLPSVKHSSSARFSQNTSALMNSIMRIKFKIKKWFSRARTSAREREMINGNNPKMSLDCASSSSYPRQSSRDISFSGWLANIEKAKEWKRKNFTRRHLRLSTMIRNQSKSLPRAKKIKYNGIIFFFRESHSKILSINN